MKAVFLAAMLSICLPSEINGQGISMYDNCLRIAAQPTNNQYPYNYNPYNPSPNLPWYCQFLNPLLPSNSPYWYFTTPPSYFTTKPTTTKATTTTTTATTTTGSSLCRYGKWTECSLNGPEYQFKRAPTSQFYLCPTKKRRCKVGAILGDLFTANFMAPSAPKAKVTRPQGQENPQVGNPGPAGNPGGAGASAGAGTGGGAPVIGGPVIGIPPVFPVFGHNQFFGGIPVAPAPRPRPPPSISRFLNLGGDPQTTAEPPSTTKKPQTVAPTTPNCTQVYEPGNGRNLVLGNCNRGRYDFSAAARQKRMTPLNEIKRDLLIMMDESGSVGVERFDKVKRLAVAIVKLLCGNIRYQHDYTRIAIMSFDAQVHFHVDLDRFYGSPKALADYITSKVIYNRYTHGKTCLSNALDYAYNTSLAKGGRRGQDKIEQDIIMITDGCANCATPPGQTVVQVIQEKSNFLADNGIHVYVIGIGLREKCKNILKILAQGGRCYHFFYLDNWSYDVDAFIGSLENPKHNQCLNVFERPGGQCLVQADDV